MISESSEQERQEVCVMLREQKKVATKTFQKEAMLTG